MTRADLSEILEPWRSSGGPTAHDPKPRLISEPDASQFMSAFADAVAGEGEVFLCDPNWGEEERAQLEALLKAKPETGNLRPEMGIIQGGDSAAPANSVSPEPQVSGLLPHSPKGHPIQSASGHSATVPSTPLGSVRSQVSQSDRGWLMIPTGGSSGKLKFARHDQDTIAAAVAGFTRHFSMARVNAAGVLPLHHVSGLMAWLRCVLTGGDYLHLDWKRVEAGELPELPAKPEGWVISLVPTQLERLLRSCRAGSPNPASGIGAQLAASSEGRTKVRPYPGPADGADKPRRGSATPPYNEPAAVEWLKRFQVIFIGGGPTWPMLLEKAAALQLPLSLGYGMTETAAMVTALRPAEFLAGSRDSGRALPHARVRIDGQEAIVIGGGSLFRGYFPEWRGEGDFRTADAGRLDDQGHLHVLGRADGVIITGGEKVNPAEVEAALMDTGQFSAVVVLGVPDSEWGHVVVAAHPAADRPDWPAVEQTMGGRLAAYKRPKRFVGLTDWPRTSAGKINRADVLKQVRQFAAGA